MSAFVDAAVDPSGDSRSNGRDAGTARPRGRSRAGILVATLSALAVLVGALVYGMVAGMGSDPLWSLGWTVVAVVGALLAASRPGNPIGWILFGGGAGTLVAMVLGGVASLTANPWLQLLSLCLFGTAWLATTSLALVHFPDGRVEGRVMRILRAGVWVLVAAMVAAVTLDGRTVDGGDVPLTSPLGVPALGGTPQLVIAGTQAAGAGVTVITTVVLLLRWRRAEGARRRRFAWIALAALIAAVLGVLGVTMSAYAVPDALGSALEFVQVSLPVLIVAGVIDPRAFDIDIVVRVSLVAVVLTAAVVAVFALVLWAFALAFGTGSASVAALVASGVVAAALAPAKSRLDAGVERLLFGTRRDPQRAVAGAASAVAAAANADDSLAAAAEIVGGSLRLGGLELRVDGADPVTWWAAPPALDAPHVERELVALSGRQGSLVAHGRSRGDDAASLAAGIDAVAPLLALVAAGVRTTASLQSAREHAAQAREDERLRLQRALHDGLAPTLVGVAMQLDALGERSPSREAMGDAAPSAVRAASHLRDAIAGLRRVIDGLRPAELDQLGLDGALRERAQSLADAGLDLRVTCTALPRVLPAVEVAAYLIASEALSNVLRHARATTCHLHIHAGEHLLVVRVEDDGRGFGGAVEGVGMPSMRARAEELGGALHVADRPGGGTMVEARLPLEAL